MHGLELRDVHVHHRRGDTVVAAVAGVSLRVERGQMVALVGESGCGKSSLGRAAAGLSAPAHGEVRFDGRRLEPLGRRRRPDADIAVQMVFQEATSSLNPRRRIRDQVADAFTARGRRTSRGARPPHAARSSEALERAGLDDTLGERFPHEISGGQRQRVLVARALAASPSVLVLDEPLASLDASAQARTANLLAELCRTAGVGMLLISHDLSIVRYVADRVAVMYLGRIVEEGPAEALWERPAHPYTRALIGAMPLVDARRELPAALEGEVPDPARPPSGCRFHPRCPLAVERCRAEEPAPAPHRDPARLVACWRADEQTPIPSSSDAA